MKKWLLIVICFLRVVLLHSQETKVIKGRILSEDLEPLPGATIYNMDSTALDTTDLNGYFSLEVDTSTREFLLNFIAMEWTTVRIERECKNLEMFVMLYVIYDWMPRNRINRKRRKRFKELPKRHLDAYNKGLFTTQSPCVSYIYSDQ